MTGLRGQVAGYLALRRAMGFKMEKYGTLLDGLAGYLDEAMITIRDSKYGKSRRIPIDATVVAALRDYLERRRALRPAPAAPALFISAYGTRLIGHLANAEFRRITTVTGTGANAVNS